MKIHGTELGDLDNELLVWFCHAWVNSILVEGSAFKVKVNELALKMGIELHCSSGRMKEWLDVWQVISG